MISIKRIEFKEMEIAMKGRDNQNFKVAILLKNVLR